MMQSVFPASTVSPSLTNGSAVGDGARYVGPTMGDSTTCSSSSGGTGAVASWAAAGGAETYSPGLFSPAGCGTIAGCWFDGTAAGSGARLRQRDRKPPSS